MGCYIIFKQAVISNYLHGLIFYRENIVNLQSGVSKFEITTVATFDDHYCTVWRVSWNVLGTILASSGDDGCVRLWKCLYHYTTF